MLDHGDVVDVLSNSLDRFECEETVIAQVRSELNSLKKDIGVNELLVNGVIKWIGVLEQLNYDNIDYHKKEMNDYEKINNGYGKIRA